MPTPMASDGLLPETRVPTFLREKQPRAFGAKNLAIG
ncbi:hypothetical protein ABIB68_007576 [Bradyrhizobium sp. F1.2.2]